MSDLVSVIIPTYNYAKYLPACLDSVLRQTEVDTEIIVVNDGSTDETEDVLTPYLDHINLINKENEGLAAARNSGIAAAQGDYFLFLDSDDLVADQSISKRLCSLKSFDDCEIVVCRNRFFSRPDSDGAPIPSGEWPLFRQNLGIHLCHFNIAPPHAFLLSRRIVEEVGLFDQNMPSTADFDYWFRSLTLGHIPRFAEGLVYYRKHETSMSANPIYQVRQDALAHNKHYALSQYPRVLNDVESLSRALAFVSAVTRTVRRFRSMDGTSPVIPGLIEIRDSLLECILASDGAVQYAKLPIEAKYYHALLHHHLKLDLENGARNPPVRDFLETPKSSWLTLLKEARRQSIDDPVLTRHLFKLGARSALGKQAPV